MNDFFFQVERAGIFSTFQDEGFFNLQHLGISTGGVMDRNLFKLSNKLLNNNLNEGVIEFAYQGPRLRLMKGTAKIVISGNVHFIIEYNSYSYPYTEFKPYQTYELKEGDVLDILATKQSVYGYFAIQGGFKTNEFNKIKSTLTRSKIGANNGNKISDNQMIYFLQKNKDSFNFKVVFDNEKITNTIRVVEGPQIDFFAKESVNKFFSSKYIVSNNIDRMGIRLEGDQIRNIKTPNIPSEGIVKGSIQVPGDGNPIVLMSDHPTIGGYPKIGTVILSDLSKISQLSPGKEIFFKKISFQEAEKEFHNNEIFLNNIFNQIQPV